MKYLRQLLKQFTEKSSTARESLAGAINASTADGDGSEGGFHGYMLTAVDDTDGERISEEQMVAAMTKATAIAKDSRIATLERENEMLRQQVESARHQQAQSSPGNMKVRHN